MAEKTKKKGGKETGAAPRFDRLSFHHHKQRLQHELDGFCEDELAPALKDGCELKGAWIALAAHGVTIDDNKRDIEHLSTGFLEVAHWFPHTRLGSGLQSTFERGMLAAWLHRRLLEEEPRCQLTFDEIWKSLTNPTNAVPGYDECVRFLNRLRKRHTIEGAVLDSVKDKLWGAFYAVEWDRDFRGRLAAEKMASREETMQFLAQTKAEVGPHRSNIHPRDVAIWKERIAYVPADMVEEKVRAYFFRLDDQSNHFKSPDLDDLDFAARQVLEVLQTKVKPKPCFLVLVPLAGTSDRSPIGAILGLLVEVPVDTRKEFDQAECPRPTELNKFLLEKTRQLRYSAPLNEALEFLSSVFTASEESVAQAITEWERCQLAPPMMASEKESGQPADIDRKYLARLALLLPKKEEKPKKEKNPPAVTSSVAHPLDAFCSGIVGFMRELLASIGWAELIRPLALFAQQERLLLGPKEHRDHYIHTLKVFLLGRALLGRMGYYNEFTRPRWILASLFHDVCYPIQKTEDWLGKYLTTLSPKSVTADVSTDGFFKGWDSQKYQDCWFDALLRLVDHRLDRWLDARQNAPSRFQSHVLHSLVRKHNHAVLGAFSLLARARGLKDAVLDREFDINALCQGERIRPNTALKPELAAISEVFDAATAILLHDPKVWGGIAPEGTPLFMPPLPTGSLYLKQPEWQELMTGCVAWALGVADAVQEWGRDLDFSSSAADVSGADSLWRKPSDVRVFPESANVVSISYSEAFLTEAIRHSAKGLKLFLGIVASVAPEEFRHSIKKRSDKCDNLEKNPLPNAVSEVLPPIGEFDDFQPNHGQDPYRLVLCTIACLNDLLDGEYAPLSKSWLRSLKPLLHFLFEKRVSLVESQPGDPNQDAPKDNPEKRARFPDSREQALEWHGAWLKDFGEALVKEAVRQPNGENTEELLANLKRLAGFWRIPYEAARFWHFPSGFEFTYVREIRKNAGGSSIIDEIIFNPQLHQAGGSGQESVAPTSPAT